MIVILDYGMGNLRSVQKALQTLGADCKVQDSIKGADKVLLPGVGAFGAAMERLKPLRAEIQSFARSGQPLMGICLGQQLLFETSEELGEHTGLELIPGQVRYFSPDMGLKVPHMGWNALSFDPKSPLTQGIEQGSQTYFVHSLYTDCADPSDVVAKTDYGITFPSMIRRDNIWGAQFHPEKGGDVGLRILQNFIEC